jgi:thiol-disulfide isomerase/thioredoxin
MKNKLRVLIALMAGVVLAGSAGAASLKIGDPAPSLDVGSWVQGEPVKGFETGRVYVVEFWATWCGPCKASIPHLNELYEEFKDKGVVVSARMCGSSRRRAWRRSCRRWGRT